MSMRDLLRARSEAPLEALELGPIIGRGSFGRVYRGQLPACCYQCCQTPHLKLDRCSLTDRPDMGCACVPPSDHPSLLALGVYSLV